MAENDKQGAAGDQAAQTQGGGFPLTVITQYVKDLSFENPGGPDSLMALKEVPHGTVRVDVRVQPHVMWKFSGGTQRPAPASPPADQAQLPANIVRQGEGHEQAHVTPPPPAAQAPKNGPQDRPGRVPPARNHRHRLTAGP